MKQERPVLGAHVSAAGGLWNAIGNGENIGAECIQIFGASPRSYAASLPNDETIAKFKNRLKESTVQAVYQHGAYLPNLGTADSVAMKRSIANLMAHLEIANRIGAQGVIFHVGSPNGDERQPALERAAAAMREILSKVKGPAQLIMENSGSVKKIGGTLEELAWLFKKVDDSRVKICIDTAHAFEAGMIERFDAEGIGALITNINDTIGLTNCVALHINDSKTPFNSNNDKHENLGKGFIGLAGFRALAREKRLAHTHWFLEVPGFDGNGPDKENMDILKSCFI